ncbi:MAG: hypothetical protein IJU23_07625 [Proteobacteria bacterium]|nr:hypothetical protein [Pseudomonadota bacterium]
MLRRKSAFAALMMTAVFAAACDDDNTSTLAALNMPGQMHIVQRCITPENKIIDLDETSCTADGGAFKRMLYIANMGTGTVSYVPYYASSEEFEAVDITTSVPGVTSIPVGERPQSIAGDSLGAFVLLTSSINNNLSVISVNDNREIAFQKLDSIPKHITYDKTEKAFYVFFETGQVRRLSISFDCGAGQDVLTTACTLTKDKISITWKNAFRLDGIPVDFVKNPAKALGYVSYKDRRYISVIGFDSESGSCLDGSASYPCEVSRLGAGFECSDGIDNDNSGAIDESDPSCFYPWSAESNDFSAPHQGWMGIAGCNDGLDNDGNGLIDALDPGCVASNDASEEDGFQPLPQGTCLDGLDNDGNGDVDRDDVHCRWPANDESEESEIAVGVGLCRDGIDNNNDGKIDGQDNACYGKNGISETAMTSSGRGNIDIDSTGKFLYVLDPVDSQLIVIDLEAGKTIDRSGWFPRNRVIGIPIARLALDVAADNRHERLYNKNGHEIYSDRVVAFVSSNSGTVTEYTITEKLTHYKDGAEIDSIESLVMQATDTDDDISYIGTIRCVGRICTDDELPQLILREKPAISYFPNENVLSDTDPKTGLPNTTIYDAIIASETWRLTYEGTLEKDTRTDGHFSAPGVFNTTMDLCALGARPGDHLILTDRKGFAPTSSACQPFEDSSKALEWEIVDAGPNQLTLKTTGKDTDVSELPLPICFTSGLSWEVRVIDQWLITSKSTYVNKRLTAGTHCVDNPLQPFGHTRFKLNPDKPAGQYDTQTAFFDVYMPANASSLIRGDAFEFTTRTGFSSLSVGMASAPTSLMPFVTDDVHFMLITEASQNTLVIYNVDEESIDDTI